MDNSLMFNILFFLLLSSSFFITRLLLNYVEFFEDKFKDIGQEKRPLANYICKILSFPDLIENFFVFFIGKGFSSINSWTLRVVFITTIPAFTSLLLIVGYGILTNDNISFIEEVFQLPLILFTIGLTFALFLFIVIGIFVESIKNYKTISLYRIPLLIISSFFFIPLSFLCLLLIISVFLFKIIKVILPVILSLLLFILNIFGHVIRSSNSYNRGYEDGRNRNY